MPMMASAAQICANVTNSTLQVQPENEPHHLCLLRHNHKLAILIFCVSHEPLSNEKYMGDALLQKTYTADFLTKKRLKNNGEVRQYYIKNDHDAIIP